MIADLEKIVRVTDPQIRPDDKSIAVVVSRVNMKDDRRDNEIVLIDIASGAQRTLTARKSAGSPRWSPSGDRLAFLSVAGEGKEAVSQLFLLPMNGGDAKQLTNGPDTVEQFAWRPDGKMIAYVTPDPTDKKAIEAHQDVFEVGDTDFLETSAAKSSPCVDGAGGRRRGEARDVRRMESALGAGHWNLGHWRICGVRLRNAFGTSRHHQRPRIALRRGDRRARGELFCANRSRAGNGWGSRQFLQASI